MKILKYIPILLVIFSCSSPEKLLQRENYDELIDKSIKKIIKHKESSEDVELLDKAYKLANEKNISRIKYLKTESNPNTWDEILMNYSILKSRQDNVRKVLPLKLHGNTLNYNYIDYDRDIVEAKRNAAEYFYSHGKKLMDNNDKESIRQAYYEFIKAKGYSGSSYSDVDQWIEKSRYMGISRALLSVVNKTYLKLPQEFTDNLLAINASDLNSEWVEYHFKPLNKTTEFDYFIDVILKNIEVTPDFREDKDQLIKTRIQDGFTYVLDKKGNVMKDSLGNDIKTPKYKELACTLIETHQKKNVHINGEINFLIAEPERLLKAEPIAATTEFYHISARAIGDIDALNAEQKKMIQVKPLPFPNDIDMVYDCSTALKGAINEVIHNNRNFIK